MVDFSALKSHVNSSLVNDAEILRLDSSRSGQADVKVGSFFGRVVNWLLPGALTGTRHADSADKAAVASDPFAMTAHQDVRMRVLDALMGRFDDHVLNQTSQLLDWSSSKPLTAREVRVVIQAAEQLEHGAKSGAGTATRRMPDTPPEPASATPAQRQGESHQDFRLRVLDSMMDRFSDQALNQAAHVVDWTRNAPLTPQEIGTFVKTAEHMQGSAPASAALSNAHIGHYSDGNRLGELQRLGAGAVNVVSSATFMQRSENREMVFKPLADKAPENFPRYGIQTRENLGRQPGAADIAADGNVVGRNIASYELAHALGMPEMITQTLATRQGGVEGIAMAKAEGASVFSTSGKLNFTTSFGPEAIEKKTAHWNEQLAQHNLKITGHTGNQVHLQKLSLEKNVKTALDKTAEFMAKNFTRAQIAGIEVTENEVVNRSGTLGAKDFESITKEHAKMTYLAKRVLTLPLNDQGLITDGKLNRDLNRLQWLDFICGQGDRNPSNLFIQYGADGKATGLTGIDNDFSFGEWVGDKGIHPEGDTAQIETGVAYQGMPTGAIDRQTADKIKLLHAGKETFRAMLEQNNMTPKEVAAAIRRLDTAHQQITAWETGNNPESHILPADSRQWETQNQDGYSAYYSSMRDKGKFVASNQVSPTQLAGIFQ
ncbi:MAG: hypothetical protein ABWY08_14875 [Comamonas sp.]